MKSRKEMFKYNEEIVEILTDKGYEIWNADRDIHNTDETVEAMINGVKVEWKAYRNCLVVGSKNSRNDRHNLRNLIVEKFGDVLSGKAINGEGEYVCFCKNAKVEDFIKLVDVIENLPFELEKPREKSRGVVKKDRSGVFNKMAKTIQFHAQIEMGQPNRRQCFMDDVDDLIIIGESIKYNPEIDKGIREHIVPCDFLIREAVEMFNEGKSITEVASMLQSNLKIVRVTSEEAKIMNEDLGLLSDMPDGWKIGDSVFARLEAANIKLK